MKTNLRVIVLSAGLMSLVLCAGCDQQSAKAHEVPAKADGTPPVFAAADEPKPTDAKPAEPAATPPVSLEAPAGLGTADTNVVQNPVPPDQLKLTPALADVIKLVQSSVGEEVLMTYITNSTDIFNIGPNEILYLHDLGVPAPIITSLIQQDSTPAAMARKQSAHAVKPLPPGLALNKPAANVFPPKAAAVPAPTPPPETAEVATNEPPAEAGPAPAVVYTVPTEVQQPVNVSYFYTELAPYGTWVDYPGYGRCWRPTVSVWNSSWRPYCDGGRWLWSDCGWYWYSDYTWGANVFHYGHWISPPGHGCLWVPDTVWAPARVHWRVTPSYCGWAPAWPDHHRHHGGRDADFVFVPKTSLGGLRLRDSLVSPTHAATLAKQANPVERADLTMLPPAARGKIRQVSVQAGEPTVVRNSRLELLENNGRTLTVTPPVMTTPTITSPAKSISSRSNQGATSGRQPSITSPQAPTANGAANNVAQKGTPAATVSMTVIPDGRAAGSIIMRGTGRPPGASPGTSVVGQPATGQPATTPDYANNTASQRASLPGGRRPLAPETVERPRTIGQPAVAKSAPTTPAAPNTAPQPARTMVVRTEPSRVISQPAVQRAPSSPAPVQPRVAPPSAPSSGPVLRTAPSAPVAATVSPRMESYRAPNPAPSPAPAPRVAAPAQSSGGSQRSSR